VVAMLAEFSMVRLEAAARLMEEIIFAGKRTA
jgi:hypothetical protein